MLLLAEIILTVVAWIKGWKWLALAPVGVAIFVGLILGLGGLTEIGAFVIFDIIAIIVLIVMVSNPKKPKEPNKV